MSKYNAYLTYASHRFDLWVMSYEQGHRLAGSSAQSKLFKHFYPRSYAPNPVQITGRVKTQYHYDLLSEFIREHQKTMLALPGANNIRGRDQLPLLTFAIPDENFYIGGWIESFQGGAKRFNPAPEFSLTFAVVKDKHSKILTYGSDFLRKWWTGEIVNNLPEIDNFPDSATEFDPDRNAYINPDIDRHGLLH